MSALSINPPEKNSVHRSIHITRLLSCKRLLDTVTVRYQGVEPITAHPLVIKEYCDPKPAVPSSMLPVEPQTSRLLDVLERKHEDRRQIQANAISFSGFRKDTNGGDDNV